MGVLYGCITLRGLDRSGSAHSVPRRGHRGDTAVGWLMSGMELNTAVGDRIPLPVIPLSNGRLDQSRLEQKSS